MALTYVCFLFDINYMGVNCIHTIVGTYTSLVLSIESCPLEDKGFETQL